MSRHRECQRQEEQESASRFGRPLAVLSMATSGPLVEFQRPFCGRLGQRQRVGWTDGVVAEQVVAVRDAGIGEGVVGVDPDGFLEVLDGAAKALGRPRDLKPSNVMVGVDGRVTVLDRASRSGSAAMSAGNTLSATSRPSLLSSARHTSPIPPSPSLAVILKWDSVWPIKLGGF